MNHSFDKASLLGSLRLFHNMDADSLRKLARLVKLKRFTAGASIIVEGESIVPGTRAAESDGLYILLVGRVEISVTWIADMLTLIQLLYSGDIFGEGALITGLPRNATAVSATDTTLLMLPASAYRYMREHDTDLTLALHDVLFRGMALHQQRGNQLTSLASITPPWLRMVKLLTLVARADRSTEGGYAVKHLSRDQLATLLHVHRATVSDILGDLERRDLIARERSKISRIVIPNMGKLHTVLKDAGFGDEEEGGVGQERADGS